MPLTKITFYCEEDGRTPVLEWLDEVERQDPKAYAKCIGAIKILHWLGHEIRRPHADYLRDKIYELRIAQTRIQYRILYFYHGQQTVVLTHGLIKEKEVPSIEIEKAISRMRRFMESPEKHSHEEELPI